MDNSQDVGKQTADQMGSAAKSVAKNKHLRRLFGKGAKWLAKAAFGIIKAIISKVVGAILLYLGPWVLAIIIALLLLLIALDAIKVDFDWLSKGGSRTEVEVLLDRTIQETFIKKHRKITAPLAAELQPPSEYGVTVSQGWINNLITQLTPSHALTTVAYFNHVQLKGDDWHAKYKKRDGEISPNPTGTGTGTGVGTDANIIAQPFHTNVFSISTRLKGVAANKADAYVAAGEKYGINPAFVAAVSMLESGNGGSNLAVQHNNVGGMSCADSNPLVKDCFTSKSNRKWSTYESVDKSIEHMAQIFKKNCVDRGNTTVYACWQVYSPPSDGNSHWGPDVVSIMKLMTTSNSLYLENANMPSGGSSGGGPLAYEMEKDVEEEFSYYFNNPVMKMQIGYSTESGETVTTKSNWTCKVSVPAPCPDGVAGPCSDIETTTGDSGPDTSSLPARQIATSATAMYKSVQIPYKYVATDYKLVSETTSGSCTYKNYEKYKVKVPDDSAGINVSQDDSQIIGFLTSFMPEGDKTTRVRSNDLEAMIELMLGIDDNFPPIDQDYVPDGTFTGGDPSFAVPIQEGTFSSPTVGPVTSEYGRRAGGGVVSSNHLGIDIGSGGRSNIPIVAAADGTVTRSYLSSSYGNTVMIAHTIDGVKFMTVYAHMANRRVSEGQTVRKGDMLGIMGTTGNSTGIHLHFELHANGHWNQSKSNAVNPRLYVNFIER